MLIVRSHLLRACRAIIEVVTQWERVLSMTELLPWLEVRGPDGVAFSATLDRERLTIGRLREYNDIALEADPESLVSRRTHCAIERDGGVWWVVDQGSVNRTFIRRDQQIEQVRGRALLVDSTTILLLARLPGEQPVQYWELTFHDPQGTRPAGELAVVLIYDWNQARLYRVIGANRSEIRDLRPQEHKLLRFMEQLNRQHQGMPVLVSYDQLITAIWGDEPGHTENEVNHLVWELRRKIELDPKNPQFLETVRGLGYRLVTRPFAG